MDSSGRKTTLWILPLLLFMGACDNPVAIEIVEEEPEEVETCEWLIPIGIELVNDYFYTLEETNLAATLGDPDQLPTSIIALNARGADLDRRAEELECDLAELNTAISAATEGLESADPVVNVFLETVRGGDVNAADVPVGDWVFVEGTIQGEPIELASDQMITLVVAPDGTASGTTGCNEYTILDPAAGGEWPVDGFEGTAGPCPSDVHAAAQDAYLDAFAIVRTYTIEDNVLVLEGSAVDLRFAQADAGD
jgi:heat shock protein HslJ